jgi:hypothetical protein
MVMFITVEAARPSISTAILCCSVFAPTITIIIVIVAPFVAEECLHWREKGVDQRQLFSQQLLLLPDVDGCSSVAETPRHCFASVVVVQGGQVVGTDRGRRRRGNVRWRRLIPQTAAQITDAPA